MKNKIFLIMLIISGYVNIVLSGERPSLQYLRIVTHVSKTEGSDHLQLWYDNNNYIPVNYHRITELKKTPDNSPATFLYCKYRSTGIVIPKDVMLKIKNLPIADISSTTSDYIFSINQLSPQELLNKLGESNKLNNEDDIKIAQQQWLEAKRQQELSIQSTSTSNADYFKPLIFLACLSLVGLYFLWRSR